VLDVLKPLVDLAILTNELEGFGIRLNKQPPRITVRKKENGGVSLSIGPAMVE
jgi:ribosome-interacting GTPase 1